MTCCSVVVPVEFVSIFCSSNNISLIVRNILQRNGHLPAPACTAVRQAEFVLTCRLFAMEFDSVPMEMTKSCVTLDARIIVPVIATMSTAAPIELPHSRFKGLITIPGAWTYI